MRKKKAKSKEEFPYIWTRDMRPRGRKGQACKVVKHHNKSQGLVVIEFAKDGEPFIVQRSGLQSREAS